MLNFTNNINIGKKLILSYLIIVIVPICLIGYFLTSRMYALSFSGTVGLSDAAVNQLKGNYLNKLSTYRDMIGTLVNYNPLMKYLKTQYDHDLDAITYYTERISPVIGRLNNHGSDVLIRLYTGNRTIGFSGETNNSMEELKATSWFKPHNTSSSALNWVKAGNVSGVGSKSYLGCYKVMREDYNQDGVNAVVAIFFEENQLYTLISEEGKAGKIVFLFNEQGEILTTTERKLLQGSMNRVLFNGNLRVDRLKDQSIVEYEKRKYLFFTKKLDDPNLSISGWTLAYLVPAGRFSSGINEIWVSSLLLCLLCVVFSLTLIMLVSGNITQRIRQLIEKMKKVREGNFKVSVQASGKDEVGMLENDFNLMVGKIDALITEVYAANLKIYEADLKIKDAEIRNQKIQTEKKEAELIALQGQINPHYLFNTLDTVRMNLLLKGDRETAAVLTRFAESFRACIDGRQDICTLQEELDLIDNYFAVQKYRHGDKIDLVSEIPDELLDCQLPKLLIQPLIENAVYHGIEMKPGGGTVHLSASQSGQGLIIRVFDNGAGMDEDTLHKLRDNIYGKPVDGRKVSFGIALRNIHNRLKLLYGETYRLSIDSGESRGTTVIIHLPLIRETPSIPEVR